MLDGNGSESELCDGRLLPTYLDHVLQIRDDLLSALLHTIGRDILGTVSIDARHERREGRSTIGAWGWVDNIGSYEVMVNSPASSLNRLCAPMTIVGVAASASEEAREGSGMTLIPPSLTFTLRDERQLATLRRNTIHAYLRRTLAQY